MKKWIAKRMLLSTAQSVFKINALVKSGKFPVSKTVFVKNESLTIFLVLRC